jgi:nitronate monooxygenase
MAGGPSTPGLVIAASAAGALGFLAGGYKTAAGMLAEMDAVQAGDTSRMNLWAGEGYRAATARPAAEVVALLSGGTG